MTKDLDLCANLESNSIQGLVISNCAQNEKNKIIYRTIDITPATKEDGKDIKLAKKSFELSGYTCEIKE